MSKCPQCMLEWDGRHCLSCGFDLGSPPRVFAALPNDTLVNSRYQLGNAIGESRQAIVYIAWDRQSNQAVLVEEFYPKSVATRSNGQQVTARQNTERFSQARELFLRAPCTGNRPLQCTDAFLHGGTAMRIYSIAGETSAESQANLLLRAPILFRDHDDQVLMTVNALPMPGLPPKRAFLPSGSIARKRRRTFIRRITILSISFAILIAVGVYLFAASRPADITLIVSLYKGQEFTLLHGEQEVEKEVLGEAISNTLINNELGDKTEWEYRFKLMPGSYTVMIQSGIDSDIVTTRTAFEVSADSNEVKAEELQPFPQVKAGSTGSSAEKVITRLQDLGYLDLDHMSGVYDSEAQSAYLAFVETNRDKNSLLLSPGMKDIYLEAYELLSSDNAIAIPYVEKGSSNERALDAINMLVDLAYLPENRSMLDEIALDAYRDFLKMNSLDHEIEASDQGISVVGWKAMWAIDENRKPIPNPPLVAIGDVDEKAVTALAQLKKMNYLPDHEGYVFDGDAWSAYEKFAVILTGHNSQI